MAMSCAKTAELIEMPFGVYTRVGPRNHEAAQIPPGEGQFLQGRLRRCDLASKSFGHLYREVLRHAVATIDC